MGRPDEPTWLGIEDLGLIASTVDAQLDGAREQHETLLRARPYVFDDHTVGRLLAVWGDTRDDLWLYDTQLDRWKAEALSPAQGREVERLRHQVAALPGVGGGHPRPVSEAERPDDRAPAAKSDLELGGGVAPGPPGSALIVVRACSENTPSLK